MFPVSPAAIVYSAPFVKRKVPVAQATVSASLELKAPEYVQSKIESSDPILTLKSPRLLSSSVFTESWVCVETDRSMEVFLENPRTGDDQDILCWTLLDKRKRHI